MGLYIPPILDVCAIESLFATLISSEHHRTGPRSARGQSLAHEKLGGSEGPSKRPEIETGREETGRDITQGGYKGDAS